MRTERIPYHLGGFTKGEIKVADITGRIVLMQPIRQDEGLINIDLSNFANGVYSYQLWSQGHLLTSQKLVLNK
jgi:hypothetical protein